MRKTRRQSLSILILCVGLSLLSTAYSADNTQQQTANAWSMLKQGKAVGFMRHALAPGMGDPQHFVVDDCSTQRNLSDEGRAQAKAIGDVLRDNGIETATILSSQWCRCLETARLLDFGEPTPVPMINSFFQDRSTEPEQTRALKQSLVQWIAEEDSPRILVSHQVNISALTGEFAQSGDMLIVTIDNEQPVVLARVSTPIP